MSNTQQLTVPKRRFGKTDLDVSIIGLGCMGMSDFYDPEMQDEEESLRVFEKCIERGVNLLDTGDFYGAGRNEKLIGKAIQKFGRDKFIIADKFGAIRDDDGNWLGFSGKPDYVKKACEASLKRLGTNYIDILILSRADPQTPIEETIQAMADLVKEGKVRYLGISEVNAETLRRANAVHPIVTLQSEYSLWSTEIEEKVLPVCRELNIVITAYSPLGRGFLTGQLKNYEDLPKNDARRHFPRFHPDVFQSNIDLVNKIENIAKEKGCTPSQLAIAWTLAQGNDIFPIPGTKRVKYLEENLGAVNVKFTDDELKKIREIIEKSTIVGDRYPDMRLIQK